MHKWIRSTQKRFSLTPSVAMAAFAPVQRLAPFRSPVVSWARARPRAEPWQRIPIQAGDQTLQKKSSNILWHFMTFYDVMRCRNHSKWGMVRHGEVWDLPDLPLAPGDKSCHLDRLRVSRPAEGKLPWPWPSWAAAWLVTCTHAIGTTFKRKDRQTHMIHGTRITQLLYRHNY